jgi:UDP-glucuronate 4-epimerase
LKILITGAAGFIGMHVASLLLARGEQVVGIDNLNADYEPSLKLARLARLQARPGFRFSMMAVEDNPALESLFEREAPRRVIHLAAQVGARHSVSDPSATVQSNLLGFANVLENCRRREIEHLVYASSCGVYGTNVRLPYSEEQIADHPVSLHAATKRSNELVAHAYSQLFGLPTTGARLFTVYGPWGRPDMAMCRFTRAILEREALELYNEGRMVRDFTYVDDVAEALVRLVDKPATASARFDRTYPDPTESDAPYRVFNVGGGQPVPLSQVVETLEATLGRTARRRMLPMQPGEVVATAANCTRLSEWIGPWRATPLREGVARFIDWYLTYYAGARAA